MRDFIDEILSFIGTTSLTDDEFNALTIESAGYDAETYNAMIAVLDGRELISNTRERLTMYFKAKGVAVTEPSSSLSNLFLGADLCSE